MTTIAFPGDDFERFRKQIEALSSPAMLKMVQDISKRSEALLKPSMLRSMQETSDRANAALRPQLLDLIQSTQEGIARAIDPSMLRLSEQARLDVQRIMTPEVLKSMSEMNLRVAGGFGRDLSEYARRIGETVVDPSAQGPEPTSDLETAIEETFADLSLTPTEWSTLYWLFGTYVTVLVTIGATLAPEIAGGIQTGIGVIMFLFFVRDRMKK